MKNNNISKHLEAFIIELHNNIRHELREKALKFNFTLSQMEVLRYVIKQKNPTMKDVANYLKITPPSVTVIIEFLIKKGLIRKEVDVSDKRVARIVITKKSSIILDEIKDKKFEILNKMLSKLSIKDQKEFVRILTILNK